MENLKVSHDVIGIVNGKEFGNQQGIHPAMFHGQGLLLYKTVSGRGRPKKEVAVKYDSSYPAYRIAKDLTALRACFETLGEYHEYLSDFIGHLLPNSDDATDKLTLISVCLDRFKNQSTGTRNWAKADELLEELSDILNGSITNE